MITASAPSWAILAVRRMAEDHAERHFKEAGHRVYLMRYRKELRGYRIDEDGRRTRCRGVSYAMRPLLPGFLFVELHPGQWIEPDVRDRWRQWYCNRERAFVSEGAIETLRGVENAGEFDEGPKRGKAGEPDVEIGALVGVEAVGVKIEGAIERLGAADQAVFRGMMFNREVAITARLKELHPITA